MKTKYRKLAHSSVFSLRDLKWTETLEKQDFEGWTTDTVAIMSEKSAVVDLEHRHSGCYR